METVERFSINRPVTWNSLLAVLAIVLFTSVTWNSLLAVLRSQNISIESCRKRLKTRFLGNTDNFQRIIKMPLNERSCLHDFSGAR